MDFWSFKLCLDAIDIFDVYFENLRNFIQISVVKWQKKTFEICADWRYDGSSTHTHKHTFKSIHNIARVCAICFSYCSWVEGTESNRGTNGSFASARGTETAFNIHSHVGCTACFCCCCYGWLAIREPRAFVCVCVCILQCVFAYVNILRLISTHQWVFLRLFPSLACCQCEISCCDDVLWPSLYYGSRAILKLSIECSTIAGK